MTIFPSEGNYLTQNYEIAIQFRVFATSVSCNAKKINNWREADEAEYQRWLIDYDEWLKVNDYLRWCFEHDVEYNQEDDPKYKQEEQESGTDDGLGD